jgi:hypothetical protein
MYDESRLPLNRVVAFAGPYISIASGAVASWLLVHVHLLGLFHLQKDGLATGIAQGVVFALTALLAWAGHSKWLQGHQLMLQQAATAAAGFAPGASVATVPGADVPPAATEINPEPDDVERTQILAAAAATAVPAGKGNGNGNGNGYGAAPEPVVPEIAPAAIEPELPDDVEFAHVLVPVGYPDVETDAEAADDHDYLDTGDMPESRTPPDNPEEM